MSEQDRLLKPGTLEPALRERTAQALTRGAVHSIPTIAETIEQGGVTFQMRLVTEPAKLEPATDAQPAARANPFLPYDPDLFVADVSPTHVALLNKFHVVEHHLLIVSREFEEQQTLLTHRDCEALLIALAEIDGLAFYNAGPEAGASQPHKHLQLIPLPAHTRPRLPIEPLMRSAQPVGDARIVPGLPFVHAYLPIEPEWIDPHKDCAATLLARYRTLMRAVGFSVEATAGRTLPSPPYNLLMTRQWLLVIPRSQEAFEGLSINALGFAGAFLVRNEAQLATLRRQGPMTALQHVALPRES